MRSFVATSVVALAASALVSAVPAQLSRDSQFPDDGFPNPDKQQLLAIEKKAFGTLSNAPPPPKPFNADTFTSLGLVAFNEIFEAAYFASMLKNLTTNGDYFNLPGVDKQFAINTIKSIVAVEELHAINANNARVKVGKLAAIKPCKYRFPVTDFKSAIELASRFTGVVEGTLQDVVFRAASNGDAAFTPGVVASVADEGEQDGWFRSILGKRPNVQPFLTRSIRDYAFSLLQDFIVPGSCPNANEINLKVFQPLTAKDPAARDQDIEFTFDLRPTRAVPSGAKQAYNVQSFKAQYGQDDKWKKLTISYLNGQNVPVSVPLKGFRLKGTTVTVKAEFPQEDNLFFGLTLAALTIGDKHANAQAMVDATLFGPAPLEVVEKPFAKTS